MLPIAKAGVLLVLIGAGVTATYAVTNGGFGNGASSGDNTQKTAESTTASPRPEVNTDSSKGQSARQAASPTTENNQQSSGESKAGEDASSQTHEKPAEGKDNPQAGSVQNVNRGVESSTE